MLHCNIENKKVSQMVEHILERCAQEGLTFSEAKSVAFFFKEELNEAQSDFLRKALFS